MHISGQLIPTIRQLNTWPRFRLRLFAEGALVGVFAGLTAGFFRFALEKGTLLREYIYTILIYKIILIFPFILKYVVYCFYYTIIIN